jgi:site-specific recombinase XerD
MVMSASTAPTFSALVQNFFADFLMSQREISPCTIASYRDTFRLLMRYLQEITKRTPSAFQLDDLQASRILDFLNHLENKRHNTARSRNLRLAAVRAFFRYAASRNPEALAIAEQVLAIPAKRVEKPMLDFLSREETEAILAAFDRTTLSGRRDFVLFLMLYNTGMRVSEIIALCRRSLQIEGSPSVRIHGKGRKERQVPLWRNTVKHLKHWMTQIDQGSDVPVFPNREGKPITRSGVESRLRLAVAIAAEKLPALKKKRVSPHTFRHTTAMHLLQAGVDITVIALWLGHESPATTHQYVEADLAMKEAALKNLQPPSIGKIRYQPTDKVLAFLEAL